MIEKPWFLGARAAIILSAKLFLFPKQATQIARSAVRRLVQAGVVLMLVLIVGSLLIAFISSARHAANRISCKNNLRGIGIALHYYQDNNGRLPSGSKPKADVPVEKRLSWLFEIMPFVENRMDPEWQHVEWKATWDAEANRPFVEEAYRVYLCPSNPNEAAPNTPGLTHYVGIAGVGGHAPLFARDDPRAGVFGYENNPGVSAYRALGIRKEDIKDGLTSTMMVVETTWQNGPWAAGGPSTVRGLDPERQPYLGESCQFGGLHRAAAAESSWFSHPQATNILFADASVRFVTPSIEPRIFEAMATIAGGEEIGDIGDH